MAKLTVSQQRAARFVDCWAHIFANGGEQSATQLVAAARGAGPKRKELRAAIESLVGREDKPGGQAKRLAHWIKRHAVLVSEKWEVRRHYDRHTRRWGYWLERRDRIEPEPLLPMEATPPPPPVVVNLAAPIHARPQVTAPPGHYRGAREPRVRDPRDPAPAEAPLVYPSGRERGERHRRTLEIAETQAQLALRDAVKVSNEWKP